MGEVWFRNLNGLERIDGLNPNEVYAKGIVRTFQVPRLFRSLTVLENLLVTPWNQLGERPLAALRGGWEREERELAHYRPPKYTRDYVFEVIIFGNYLMAASRSGLIVYEYTPQN